MSAAPRRTHHTRGGAHDSDRPASVRHGRRLVQANVESDGPLAHGAAALAYVPHDRDAVEHRQQAVGECVDRCVDPQGGDVHAQQLALGGHPAAAWQRKGGEEGAGVTHGRGTAGSGSNSSATSFAASTPTKGSLAWVGTRRPPLSVGGERRAGPAWHHDQPLHFRSAVPLSSAAQLSAAC